MIQNKKAVTLIELIIVTTIIAILGTIGFLSLQGWTQSARDSVRTNDINNIDTSLNLYSLHRSRYPEPTDGFDVVYEGYPLWTQGVFGLDTQNQTGKIYGDLIDPKYENQYTYSTTQSRKEYQLGTIYERTEVSPDYDILSHLDLVNQTYANTNSIQNLDPTTIANMEFWYDGMDADADYITDIQDSSIENIGVVSEVTAQDFTPFYFDRVIWLDAQDINGDATLPFDNEEIDVWKNKTGAGFNGFVPTSGNNHSNPSSSTAPTFSSTGFAGNPGVVFDGLNEGNRIVIDRGAQPKGEGFSLAYTFIINDSATSNATIISVGPTGGGEYFNTAGGWQLSRDAKVDNFIFRINGDIISRTYFDGTTCSSCGSSGNSAEVAFGTWDEVNDALPHTVFVKYEGDTVTGYLDGTKRFEATLSSSTQPFGEYFRLFGNRAGTAYLTGMLGELFIANDRMSLQDIQNIEGYFARRWNWLDDLPAGHPYKTVTPQMDALSELDYVRYSGPTSEMTSYDPADFLDSNPSLLNSETVRYPGSMPGINIQEEYKTHIWKGPIRVSESGDYTFYTESDDYSFLLIDGVTVLSNAWNSSINKIESVVTLDKDTTYDFELVYGQVSGSSYFDYGVNGPGIIGYRKYQAFAWNDKSGGGNNLVQTSEDNRPTYNSSSLGFAFDPQTYFDFSAAPFSAGDDIEILAVWQANESDTSYDLDGYLLENDSGGLGQLFLGAGGMNAGGSILDSDLSIKGKKSQVTGYKIDEATSLQQFIIGGQIYRQDDTQLNTYNTGFTLGGKVSGFDGYIKEVIGYDASLSEDDRIELEGYLAHKWGIADQLYPLHKYFSLPETVEETYVGVTGNYNGIFVHSALGDNHKVIATPSIIGSVTSTGTTVDISTLIGENSLVLGGYVNMPGSYIGSIYDSEKLVTKNGVFFNIDDSQIFEGDRQTLASYEGISQIDEKIRSLYSDVDFSKNVARYLDTRDSDYVKEILGNIIGINPIQPYYCKDILEKGIGMNIALDGIIEGSSGKEVSGGIDTLIDGEVSNIDDYSYMTNPGDTTAISITWEDAKDIGYVRVYNSFGTTSGNLWAGTLQLLNASGDIEYQYNFGETSGISFIDIEIPEDTLVNGITKLLISPINDFDEIGLREIEVYESNTLESGTYSVDSDGIGGAQEYSVYCDMETDGGGWTKVGNNFIDRPSFHEGSHPSIYQYNDTDNNIIREFISSPLGSEGNVVQQTGDENTYYGLLVDNIPSIDFTTEIRISAWVADVWNYGESTTGGYGYIFDNRLTYTDGTYSTNGTLTTLETALFDGRLWKKQMVRIPIEKEAAIFEWNLGKGAEGSGKDFYFTDAVIDIYYR